DPPTEADDSREGMLAEIAAEAADTSILTGRASFSSVTMAAIGRVPRHRFVKPSQEPVAYVNGPLPIGFGQTISQPFIVALMSDLLDLEPGQRVLEVGTGSGYQTAVLVELGAEVYSVEIVPELAEEASRRLAELGYAAQLRVGDGYEGWSEHAPFDRIIVTAAAPVPPPPLLDQLAAPGQMVIPLGRRHTSQVLTVVDRNAQGTLTQRAVLPVAFVPLTREGVE